MDKLNEGRLPIWKRHLLFRDLCMRAGYGVIVSVRNDTICNDYSYQKEGSNMRLRGVHCGTDYEPYSGYGVMVENGTAFYDLDSWEVKPYVRPIDSMTEEERKQYNNLKWYNKERYPYDSVEEMEWLVINHFDIFNLLNYDLAIELTPENNPYIPKFKIGDTIQSKYGTFERYTIEGISGGYYDLNDNMQLLICRQKGWEKIENNENETSDDNT